MTIGFPISIGAFFDLLPIVESDIRLAEAQQMTRLADGSMLRANIGAPLWQGSYRLAPMSHDDHARVAARIALLQRPGASFFALDPAKLWPRADYGALTLRRVPRPANLRSLNWTQIRNLATVGTAYAPTIRSISADLREIRLQNLPPDYNVALGDYISFTYGSNPTRYAFHQVVQGNRANGNGVSTDWIEVTPALRPGATVGTTVNLYEPRFKAVLTSVNTGTSRTGFSQGIQIDFTQTLR